MNKNRFLHGRGISLLFLPLLVIAFSVTLLSCSDDDDFADAIAYFQNEESGIGLITLAFYDDSSFVLHKKFTRPEKTNGKTVVEDYDIATGTWSGTVKTDGNVTCVFKKAVSNGLVPMNNARWLFGGNDEEKLGNDDYPLTVLSEPITKSYAISDGKITYEPIDGIELDNKSVSGWQLVLTRQN